MLLPALQVAPLQYRIEAFQRRAGAIMAIFEREFPQARYQSHLNAWSFTHRLRSNQALCVS